MIRPINGKGEGKEKEQEEEEDEEKRKDNVSVLKSAKETAGDRPWRSGSQDIEWAR